MNKGKKKTSGIYSLELIALAIKTQHSRSNLAQGCQAGTLSLICTKAAWAAASLLGPGDTLPALELFLMEPTTKV